MTLPPAGVGEIHPAQWRRYWKLLRLLDACADVWVALALRRHRAAARRLPPQAVLLAGIEVPGREADLARVVGAIAAGTRHRLTVALTRMQDMGKFDNVNRAIAGHDPARHDWLLVVDDDVALPKDFLDLLLYFAAAHALKLAQPAHRFLSYSTYAVTERHFGALARRCGFVEIGPVTLLHRDSFAELLPFPSMRWAWALDLLWADVARRHGWAMGIIDATPIRHLRPVGGAYDTQAAREERAEHLRARQLAVDWSKIYATTRRIA